MEPEVNIGDICRICGINTSGMVRHFIFDDCEVQHNLPTKILSCLPILISEEDSLPKFICGECVYKLDILYDFRTISVKTEQYLLKLIQNRKCENTKQVKSCNDKNKDSDFFNNENHVLPSVDVNTVRDIVSKESENVVENSVNDKFIPVKKTKRSRLEISLQIPNRTSEVETEVAKHEGLPRQIRTRPIRAVRLNSEISYSSDSILESLLKKNTTSGSKKLKKGPNKQKKAILRQCKYCKIVLTSREYYTHINDEHKKQHECNICRNRFPSLGDLNEHRELKDHSFSDKDEEQFKGGRILKCNQCQKTYLRKHLLVLHMRRHTGERPFPCHLCDRKYACKSSLNSHLLKHKEEWKHVCNFCGKGFVDKHSFIYHVRSNHTGERPFACQKCERRFIKKQDLLKHEQTQHSEMPKELFACEKCGRVCKDYDALRSHRRSHIPVEVRRVHKCTLCEASFTGKTGLMKHMHRHTGEMPYECEQCAKRFFTKKGLELHLIIHSGVKSFICEYCGRAFSQDNTLRVHRRTHTGERPYECNICLKRFTQSSALNSHRKLHSKDN